MGKKIDAKGEKYGRLTAIEETDKRTKGGGMVWNFRCDCGNIKAIPLNSVRTGLIKSCGCLAKPHGESNTRLYDIWVNMRMRCKHNHKYWGAKGIKVCDEWMDYITFRNWSMENGYSDNLTIDRIDNDGDYCPQNCRWTTFQQQAENAVKKYFFMDGEYHSIKEWCNILNTVTSSTVYKRIRKGWSVEKALKTPNVRKQGVWRI